MFSLNKLSIFILISIFLKKACAQINIVIDFSVDCALKLQQGLADFGVFTAEEALLASKFIDKSVQVIADIRHNERRKGDLSLFCNNVKVSCCTSLLKYKTIICGYFENVFLMMR